MRLYTILYIGYSWLDDRYMGKHTHTSSIIRTEEGWESEWKVAVIHTSAGWYIVYRLIIQYNTKRRFGHNSFLFFLILSLRICIFVSGGGGPLVFLANDLPKREKRKELAWKSIGLKKRGGYDEGGCEFHISPLCPLPLVVVVVLGSAKSRMVTNWYNKKR